MHVRLSNLRPHVPAHDPEFPEAVPAGRLAAAAAVAAAAAAGVVVATEFNATSDTVALLQSVGSYRLPAR